MDSEVLMYFNFDLGCGRVLCWNSESGCRQPAKIEYEIQSSGSGAQEHFLTTSSTPSNRSTHGRGLEH